MARLRFEGTGARLALADRRLGLAYAGADPARPSRRVNPRAAFTAAPSVSAHQVLGAGHNIDHHHAGSQYRHDVLDWAGNLPAREETA